MLRPTLNRRDPLSASMTFAAAIVVFGGAGWWLDHRFGTTPFALLVGMLIGIAGGFVHMIHAVAPDLLPFGRSRLQQLPPPAQQSPPPTTPPPTTPPPTTPPTTHTPKPGSPDTADDADAMHRPSDPASSDDPRRTKPSTNRDGND